MTSTSPRVSFRLAPDTKAVATQIAAANGLTLAGMVREFLFRYVMSTGEPLRKLPNTRGAPVTTIYVGPKLARAARIRAERNNEDLSRPIVEFLTTVVEHWQAETAQTPHTSTAPQPTEAS